MVNIIYKFLKMWIGKGRNYYIHPDNPKISIWKGFISFIDFYIFIFVPYELIFETSDRKDYLEIFLLDIFLIIDILIGLFIAYYHDLLLITNNMKIMKHNFRHNCFKITNKIFRLTLLFKLMAALPFKYYHKDYLFVKLLRIFTIRRFFHILKKFFEFVIFVPSTNKLNS